MDNKSNSHRSREMGERAEIQPVVKGDTAVKKETVGKKFADVFLADNIKNVKDYIIFDVLVPAINDTIVDMLTSGVSMLFKGQPNGSRSGRGYGRSGLNEKKSYNSLYSRSSDRDRRDEPYYREGNGFKEIGYALIPDAKKVRTSIYDILDHYGNISVQEYYGLSNNSNLSEITDAKRGWTSEDIRGEIGISRGFDGRYYLDLPRPNHLD